MTEPQEGENLFAVGQSGLVHRPDCPTVIRAKAESDATADWERGYVTAAPTLRRRSEIRPTARACRVCAPDWQKAAQPTPASPMREAAVVDAFHDYLVADGWTVRREFEFADLVAEHPDGRRLYVEAKGKTSSPGLDVDTLYGQLLRRMRPDEEHTRYAVVVPESLLSAAERVPREVRQRLRVDVYAVDNDLTVRNV